MLVTFEIDWDTHPPKVRQTKWTLTGQRLDRKQFHLSLLGHRVGKVNIKPFDTPGIHTYGHRTLKRLALKTSEVDKVDLLYDDAIDKLSVRWNHCVQPTSYGSYHFFLRLSHL